MPFNDVGLVAVEDAVVPEAWQWYQDAHGRALLVEVVAEVVDPKGRDVIGTVSYPNNEGYDNAYATNLETFGKVWQPIEGRPVAGKESVR